MKECWLAYRPNRTSKVIYVYLLVVISLYLCMVACAVVQPHIRNACLCTTCVAVHFALELLRIWPASSLPEFSILFECDWHSARSKCIFWEAGGQQQ